MVYWTPLGKNTVRMVPTVTVDVPRGGFRGTQMERSRSGVGSSVACTPACAARQARCSAYLPRAIVVGHHHPSAPVAGAKPDKESVPGVKLKTENKKPIVALAAHPAGARGDAATALQPGCGGVAACRVSLPGATCIQRQ